MNSFKAVAKFEFKSTIKNKGFISLVIIMTLFAIISGFLPNIFSLIKNGNTGGNSAVAIYLKNDNANYKDFQSLYKNAVQVTDESSAKNDVIKGKYSKLISIYENDYALYKKVTNLKDYNEMYKIDNILKNEYLTSLLKEYNVPTRKIEQSENFKMQSKMVSLDANNVEGDQKAINMALAYIVVFLLYMSLIPISQFIVVSILYEKSSRAMELLITSTKPINLILGKVFGVGLAGISQFSFVIILYLVSNYVGSIFLSTADSSFVSEVIKNLNPQILIFAFLFFVLGFFQFAFLFAAFASTASKMEEASSVSSLGMMFIIVGFLIAILSLNNPNNIFSSIASFIPFFSPFVMLSRYTAGFASVFQVIISLIILVISIILTGYISAKIYKVGVLMYGQKPKLIRSLKMAFK